MRQQFLLLLRLVSVAAACEQKSAVIDLVFILDVSTSVGELNFNKVLDFTKAIIPEGDVDNGTLRVGVLTFSTEVYVQFHLNSYHKASDMFRRIDEIPYRYGSTNTADALKTMRQEMFVKSNGDRPYASNVCIILTDGVSNINKERTRLEAELAHKDGIHIFAIGIGLTDTEELLSIASPPSSDNSFSLANFDELSGLNNVFSIIFESRRKLPL